MAIFDLFSKRRQRERKSGQPDVYRYDDLPTPFRIQVIHIWNRALGQTHVDEYLPREDDVWSKIEEILAEEHGLANLGNQRFAIERTRAYFSNQEDIERALDVIELTFKYVSFFVDREHELRRRGVQENPQNAIRDLNQRFREHGLGYQFEGSQIVRVDSQFIHAEAVKPALSLLQTPGFEGAEQEFQQAHKHYRSGDFQAVLTYALKAFESTMKSICVLRKWPYDPHKDTAKRLIEIVLHNKLIPSYLQSSFTGIRTVLESTVPTARNRDGGHGDGPEVKIVPDYLAAYVLHVTASNIVLLVEAHKTKP